MSEPPTNPELNELIGYLELFRILRDLPPMLVAVKAEDGNVKPEGILI